MAHNLDVVYKRTYVLNWVWFLYMFVTKRVNYYEITREPKDHFLYILRHPVLCQREDTGLRSCAF